MARPSFINRGGRESNTKINPVDHVYDSSGYNYWSKKTRSGLFERTDFDIAEIENKLLLDTGSVALDEWQIWAQNNWKAEHGSASAAIRFSDKLIEEFEEACEELYNFQNCPEADKADVAKRFVSEVGDTLWCSLSGASNAGVSIESALQSRLLEFAMGTVAIDEAGKPRHPVWRESVLGVATSNIEPVKIGDIDRIFENGFVPQASPTMNILADDTYREADFELAIRWVRDVGCYAHGQYNLQLDQFGIDEADESSTKTNIESFQYYSEKISELAAVILLDSVHIVRGLAGVGFSDIVRINCEKLSGRVAAGLIDRSDGERPDHLK